MQPPGSETTLIVLVRHGETEWNRVERFRGRIDVPLNETGHQQARAVARRLVSWPLAAIYSSPLKRALDTAQPIASACGLDLSVLEALIDVDYGGWAGLSREEAGTRQPDLFATWRDNPFLARFPEGESVEDVRRRAWGAMETLRVRHAGKLVALVSHVVVNRVLICAALGLGGDGFWRVGQDNAAISVLEASPGRYRLLLLNDTCHLEDISTEIEQKSREEPSPV